jgi:ankyrin repeat protein
LKLRKFIYLQDGYTALLHAAFDNQVECVRMLLDAFANTRAKTNVR